MTNPGVAISMNLKYIVYGYDVLTNLTLNNEDTRLILNRGITVCPDGLGIQLRSKSDSCLGDSIDSKTMFLNLCLYQKHHPIIFFLTCNQSEHMRIRRIKNYLDLKHGGKFILTGVYYSK